MRVAAVFCLCFTLSYASSATECDSALQIIEAKGQLIIKNTSDKPIIAYVLTNVKTKSQDRAPTRTYDGTFSDKDLLAPGQSMEIGKADIAPKDLSIDYVRFAGGWQCDGRSGFQKFSTTLRIESDKSPSPR